MPRLSRDDAGRVIAALHRLMELDGACADQLDIGRVLGRLSNRADLPEAARGPDRLPTGAQATPRTHASAPSMLHRTG